MALMSHYTCPNCGFEVITEDNYTVGIIDMDFTVRSDDRSLEIKHADLLNCIIRNIVFNHLLN